MNFRYRNTGVIKEGKRIYDDPSLHSRLLRSLDGKRFEEYTREIRIPATPQQKAFYVGVVLKEAHRHEQFAHYNQPIDIHKQLFAPAFLRYYNEKGEEKVRNLRDLSEQEMWDLTERVIAFLASEHQIIIAEQSKYYIK